MKILLLGKDGQLGWELQRELMPLGEVLALDYPEIDLARPETLRDPVRQARPQLILNATAYTAVDRAESEAKLAMSINGKAPRLLAELAQEGNSALVHYSTDYVFDGQKGSPYLETDVPNPLNVYGRSKLVGETGVAQSNAAYLILRTSWVYSLRRESFVTKVLEWSRQQPTLRIVSDQVGNPTWARALASATALLLAKAGTKPAGWIHERRGVYHLAGNGHASRFEWAKAILRLDPCRHEQRCQEILPAQSSEFPTPALRPLFSALDCRRFSETFGLQLPPWGDTLGLAMQTV